MAHDARTSAGGEIDVDRGVGHPFLIELALDDLLAVTQQCAFHGEREIVNVFGDHRRLVGQ